MWMLMPLDIHTLIESCTDETTPDTLKAVVSSAQLQDQGKVPWLTTFTDDSFLLDLNFKQSSLSELTQVPLNEIQQAQNPKSRPDDWESSQDDSVWPATFQKVTTVGMTGLTTSTIRLA